MLPCHDLPSLSPHYLPNEVVSSGSEEVGGSFTKCLGAQNLSLNHKFHFTRHYLKIILGNIASRVLLL